MSAADDLLDGLERRIKDLEPAKVEPLRKEAPPPPAKTPPGWIFTPVRDDDKLIVQIIARPIDG